jgi:hypothetical protein
MGNTDKGKERDEAIARQKGQVAKEVEEHKDEDVDLGEAVGGAAAWFVYVTDSSH